MKLLALSLLLVFCLFHVAVPFAEAHRQWWNPFHSHEARVNMVIKTAEDVISCLVGLGVFALLIWAVSLIDDFMFKRWCKRPRKSIKAEARSESRDWERTFTNRPVKKLLKLKGGDGLVVEIARKTTGGLDGILLTVEVKASDKPSKYKGLSHFFTTYFQSRLIAKAYINKRLIA